MKKNIQWKKRNCILLRQFKNYSIYLSGKKEIILRDYNNKIYEGEKSDEGIAFFDENNGPCGDFFFLKNDGIFQSYNEWFNEKPLFSEKSQQAIEDIKKACKNIYKG